MELSQARYFLATADTLNYTHAADSCHVSRQALRQSLQALETEIGAPLFRNERNRIALTDVGISLALTLRPALEQLDRGLLEVKEFVARGMPLRIGYASTFLPFLLPDLPALLQKFADENLSILCTASAYRNDHIVEAVRSGKTDCAVLVMLSTESDVGPVTPLDKLWLSITVRQDDPLGGRPSVRLSELDGRSFVGVDPLDEALLPFKQTMEREGLTFQYRHVEDTVSAIHETSSSGSAFLGVCERSLPFPGLDLVTIPIEDFPCWISLLQSSASANTLPVRLLRAFLQEHIGDLKGDRESTKFRK